MRSGWWRVCKEKVRGRQQVNDEVATMPTDPFFAFQRCVVVGADRRVKR
jgi:hypothetical protein